MEITDVRVKLVNNATDRLKAFCSVTLDDEFVIRDIKLVEGASGLFVAMPSRKLTASCPSCRHKNPLRAHFCNECGADLPRLELPVDDHGRLRLYRDIAHPITPEFREKMQGLIVEAYKNECERSTDPDYEPVAGVDLDDVVDAANAADTEDREEKTDEVDDTDGNQRKAPSEYAALIAGLDQGSRSGGDHAQSRRPDRGRSEKAQDSRGGQQRRSGRRRKPNDERRDGVTKPRTAPAAMVSAKDGITDKPLFEKAETPRKEPPASTQRDDSDKVSLNAATENSSPADSQDDTSAFGAGLL